MVTVYSLKTLAISHICCQFADMVALGEIATAFMQVGYPCGPGTQA